MEMFHPLFLAHEQHEYSIKVNVEMWEERIKKLEAIQKAGGGLKHPTLKQLQHYAQQKQPLNFHLNPLLQC